MQAPAVPRKETHQIKALLLKNLHLQKRQPCTNCCQILTPIICLVITIFIRNAAIDNIPTDNDTIYASLPLISSRFNDYFLFDQMPKVIHREKEQWLLFQCEHPEDRAFVGQRVENRHSGMLGQVESTYQYTLWINSSMGQGDYDIYGIPPVFVEPK